MSANAKQIAGEHYLTPLGGVQLWDYLIAIEAQFLEGNAAKYIFRWRKKGGLQDLQKAMHYVEKRIERPRQRTFSLTNSKPGMFEQLLNDNNIHPADAAILDFLLHHPIKEDSQVVGRIKGLIAEEQRINARELRDAYEITDQQAYLGEFSE